MTMLIVEYTFKDNATVALEGPQVKLWLDYGLPNFRGTLEEFEVRYPVYFAELLAKKIIKHTVS